MTSPPVEPTTELPPELASAWPAQGEPDVGARMRDLRELRRLRLRDVADRAGLSTSFLSQLERGRANASVPSLLKIAKALNVTMADLFHSEESRQPAVLRVPERPTITFGMHCRKWMLTPRPLGTLEVFIAEIGPGGSTGDEAYVHGDSEELFLVMSGSLQLELGDDVHQMGEGDSIVYRSSIPHRASNASAEPGVALWAISPPSY